jgi:hypothetical protein
VEAGKKKVEILHGINDVFLQILKNNTAGSPMDENIKWTNLTEQRMEELLKEDGYNVGIKVVKQLLKKNNFRKRKPFKSIAGGNSEFRDDQFKNIESLKSLYISNGNPVISMDVKKKELIGEFSRGGELYTQERINVNDHDFRSQSTGMVVPHGIYDYTLNKGYINIGTSHDTSEFGCDCILEWWQKYGSKIYKKANSILILCDCGGSNNARYYIFKEKLIELSDKIGIEIRIAHYPPYTSKYNPIEHRLFPHVTRACKGLIFNCLDIVKEAMSQTSTKTGLEVFVDIIDKTYETGLKVKEGFKENMRIVFDKILPKWNYWTTPIRLAT